VEHALIGIVRFGGTKLTGADFSGAIADGYSSVWSGTPLEFIRDKGSDRGAQGAVVLRLGLGLGVADLANQIVADLRNGTFELGTLGDGDEPGLTGDVGFERHPLPWGIAVSDAQSKLDRSRRERPESLVESSQNRDDAGELGLRDTMVQAEGISNSRCSHDRPSEFEGRPPVATAGHLCSIRTRIESGTGPRPGRFMMV